MPREQGASTVHPSYFSLLWERSGWSLVLKHFLQLLEYWWEIHVCYRHKCCQEETKCQTEVCRSHHKYVSECLPSGTVDSEFDQRRGLPCGYCLSSRPFQFVSVTSYWGKSHTTLPFQGVNWLFLNTSFLVSISPSPAYSWRVGVGVGILPYCPSPGQTAWWSVYHIH